MESIIVDSANTIYDSRNNCNAIIEKSTGKLVAGCKNTIIPSDVKIIGNASFSGHGEISSINIPDGVVTIEPYAFDQTGLVSIELPNSIVTIENNAFEGCEKLQCVTLGNAVDTLGNEVFKDCSVLSLINIPEGVKEMGWGVFQHCTSLESIEIPSSISHLQGYTFCGCTSLKSVKLNEGTTIIGRYAFAGCSSLEEITLPSTVKSIAMKGSTESCAFKDCTALKTVVLKNGLELIGTYTFEECTNLSSIQIPESVTSICSGAFKKCHSLSSLLIPNSVKFIHVEAFRDCSGLETISVEPGNTVYDSRENCNAIIETATNKLIAGSNNTIIPNGVTTIGDYSFSIRNKLKTLNIPNTVTSIGVSAFWGCSSLSSVVVPESVTIIESYAFNSCEGLTYIAIGKGVTYIHNDAFANCEKLKDVYCNAGSIPKIVSGTFQNTNIGNVTLHVPKKLIDSYKTTEIWKTFGSIVVLPSIRYMIDDELFKTVAQIPGYVIIQEEAPVKDGYTFGGWEELPETMPDHDIEVTGTFYLYGDVNIDAKVNVVDVVDIARFVVETPSEAFREKLADLNTDLSVNIADAVVLVNHIAGEQNFVRMAMPKRSHYDYDFCDLRLMAGEDNDLSLSLTGDMDFTAFQFEVDVPDGADISAMRINSLRKDGHQLLFNKVADNRYRVAALSMSNAVFKGNDGELLNISLEGMGSDDICIHDIHFVTTNGTDILFDNHYINGNTTGIADVRVKENAPIYDLQGRLHSTFQRGMNIVGRRKIIVK